MRKYIFISLLYLVSCSGETNNESNNTAEENALQDTQTTESTDYKDQNKFTADEQDSLLVNLTSFIFAKPDAAQWDTKFELRFRQYFIDNSNQLELIYLKQMADSSYYYYLIRDARDRSGYRNRGVAGRFRMNADMSLYDFEEIINTPAAGHDKLVEMGGLFMDELVQSGNLDKFLDDKTMVEWPDGRLFYSKEKFEWRYVE